MCALKAGNFCGGDGMRTLSCVTIAASVGAILLYLPSASHAATVSVTGHGLVLTMDCDGRDAKVAGQSNHVIFRKGCQSLNLAGSDNRVEIELKAGQSVNVVGADNNVRYRLVGGAQAPTVNLQGADNHVDPAK
jgi:hypothetical protein